MLAKLRREESMEALYQGFGIGRVGRNLARAASAPQLRVCALVTRGADS